MAKPDHNPPDPVAELREVTRVAHEAIKDLRLTVREAKGVIAEIEQTIHGTIDEQINTTVADGLANYDEVIREAITDATDRVFKRFDELADILMGEDKKSRKAGLPSVTEMVESGYVIEVVEE